MASNRLKHGWYAQRNWQPTSIQGQPVSWAELYGGGVRWILVESVAESSEQTDGTWLPENAPFDQVERYRVEEGPGRAVVWELVPRSETKAPG